MRETFSYEFYCRKSKANRNGKAHIELSICINGIRKFINLPMLVSPEEFNRKRKPKIIQDYLDSVTFNIQTYSVDMAKEGIAMTTDNLIEVVKAGGIIKNIFTLENLFDEYDSIISKKIGTEMSIRHYMKYGLAQEVFFRVIDKKRPVRTLTNADILKYINELLDLKESTRIGYIMRIKSVVKYARANGYINIDPFIGIKTPRPVPEEIIYLTKEEYMSYKTKNLHSESLEKVRDMFIIQANTGLSYCDLKALRKEDIQVTEDGIHFIKKARQKTGTQFVSIILPDGLDILKKYEFNLPVISNQKMNSYIQEGIILSGVKKHITTHCGRHTYGMNLLNSGVRLDIVAKCLGHKDTRVTRQHYARLIDTTVITEVKKSLF